MAVKGGLLPTTNAPTGDFYWQIPATERGLLKELIGAEGAFGSRWLEAAPAGWLLRSKTPASVRLCWRAEDRSSRLQFGSAS